MPDTRDILYQMILNSTYAGQSMQNVLWFRTYFNTPYTTGALEIDALHSSGNSWWVANFLPLCNNAWSPVTLVTKAMNGPEPLMLITNYTNVVGLKSGDGMPPHDAAVISFYTDLHGKRFHGRSYVPALNESDHSNGVWNAPAQTQIKKIGDDLMTRFGPQGTSTAARLVVFSRKNGATRFPGPPPYISYNSLAGIYVTRFTVSSKVRTQRHRLMG